MVDTGGIGAAPAQTIAEMNALRWYHTIELPGGLITPGEYDTRRALAKVAFPTRLDGLRCLDVGTHDGFWAFEMERRGASEVVAIDLDDPTRVDISEPVPEPLPAAAVADRRARLAAFAWAHRALGSSVMRRDLSVYDLDPGEVGEFDFAFLGTLLLHLREPLRALAAVRGVLRPGGRLLVNDAVSLSLSLLHPRRPLHALTLLPGKPFWWLPNARGLQRYLEKAGFEVLCSGRPFLVPRGAGYDRPRLASGRRRFLWRALHERGMVHAWVLGQVPRPR
jgi:tRNA (mo5U34)-methyltransferase